MLTLRVYNPKWTERNSLYVKYMFTNQKNKALKRRECLSEHLSMLTFRPLLKASWISLGLQYVRVCLLNGNMITHVLKSFPESDS